MYYIQVSSNATTPQAHEGEYTVPDAGRKLEELNHSKEQVEALLKENENEMVGEQVKHTELLSWRTSLSYCLRV